MAASLSDFERTNAPSNRIPEMLIGMDVSEPRPTGTDEIVETALREAA